MFTTTGISQYLLLLVSLSIYYYWYLSVFTTTGISQYLLLLVSLSIFLLLRREVVVLLLVVVVVVVIVVRVVILAELVLVVIVVVRLFRIISVTTVLNVENEGKSAGRSTCSLILSNYSLLLLHNAYLLIPYVPRTTLMQ